MSYSNNKNEFFYVKFHSGTQLGSSFNILKLCFHYLEVKTSFCWLYKEEYVINWSLPICMHFTSQSTTKYTLHLKVFCPSRRVLLNILGKTVLFQVRITWSRLEHRYLIRYSFDHIAYPFYKHTRFLGTSCNLKFIAGYFQIF